MPDRALDGISVAARQELKQLAAQALAFHPFANVFPLMVGKDFDVLVADIKARGPREPIVIFEGKVLDGRNRYRACLKAGIELPQFEQFDGTEADARAFVFSKNFCRRDLKPKQKRDLLVEWVKTSPEKSDRALAREAGTTHPTIAKARKQAEATGKTLPVEKRTGSDGKARKQPAKKSLRRLLDGNHRANDRYDDDGGARRDGGHGLHHGRDVGAAAGIDDLQDRLRRQTIQIAGLESEIEELKAAAVAEGTASQLVDKLESRLRRDGVEAAVLLRKIRDRINQHKPQIDLKAMPAVGAA